jgi:hypothetical protein
MFNVEVQCRRPIRILRRAGRRNHYGAMSNSGGLAHSLDESANRTLQVAEPAITALDIAARALAFASSTNDVMSNSYLRPV